jgi:hypothetical protein
MDTIHYERPAKPGLLEASAILTIISGGVHLLGFVTLFVGLAIFGLATFGLGCCLLPLSFLPLFLGLYEVRYGLKLMADPAGVYEANRTLAIVQICLIVFGNILAFSAGLVSLLAYSDERSGRYFAALRGERQAPPPSATPPAG